MSECSREFPVSHTNVHMMSMKSRTLVVRHLPSCLTEAEKVDLLRYFGGESVRCMSTTGRLRHTAFVTFPTQEAADSALGKLHQAELLGRRLVVEYADGKQVDKYFPSKIDDLPSKNLDKEENEPQPSAQDKYRAKVEEFARKIHSMCPELGLDYILNPMLRYAYPAPSPSIVANICSMLVSVPKFYTQVLHLMNKMNLPAPFGPLLPQPPMMQDVAMAQAHLATSAATQQLRRESSSSFEESEMESDEEAVIAPTSDVPAPPMKRRTKLKMRRPKLQKLLQPRPVSAHGPKPVTNPAEVFESVTEAAPAKQIAFNIRPQLEEQSHMAKQLATEGPSIIVEEGGFGMITSKPSLPEVEQESVTENPYKWEGTEFLSRREIKAGRASSQEMQQSSVFRNYDMGTPASRLYVKNVAKGVEVDDLFRIYGSYVDPRSHEERNAFDIRLMTEGRMKGQAFLTFASEKQAEQALQDTNGFLLKGKPLVVQFARSAKPKATPAS